VGDGTLCGEDGPGEPDYERPERLVPGARRPEIHLQPAAAPHHRFARNDEDRPRSPETQTGRIKI